jgi:hypothetical protein
MGKHGRRSGAKSTGCASRAYSASDECLDIWLGRRLRLRIGRGRGGGRGCRRRLWLCRRGRVTHGGSRRERACGPCRQARARRGRAGERGKDGGDGEDAGGAAEEGGGRLAGPGSGEGRALGADVRFSPRLAQPLADLAAAHPLTPFANALQEDFCLIPLALCSHALLWIEPGRCSVVGPTQPNAPAQGLVCPTTAPTLGLAYNLAAALSRPRDSLCLVQPVLLAATALAAISVTRHCTQVGTLRSTSHIHHTLHNHPFPCPPPPRPCAPCSCATVMATPPRSSSATRRALRLARARCSHVRPEPDGHHAAQRHVPWCVLAVQGEGAQRRSWRAVPKGGASEIFGVEFAGTVAHVGSAPAEGDDGAEAEVLLAASGRWMEGSEVYGLAYGVRVCPHLFSTLLKDCPDHRARTPSTSCGPRRTSSRSPHDAPHPEAGVPLVRRCREHP